MTRMQGIEDFLRFIDDSYPGVYVPVDLLKLTQAVGIKLPKRVPNSPRVPFNPANLCIAIDGESCLDRLYGGYFNDWACGGQWNRMLQFLHILLTTVSVNNIMMVVFLNGANEMQRFPEWSSKENEKRNRVRQIFRHVRAKGTPPPKVLWMPPVGLRSALRMALRRYNIPVIQTTEDHKQEVMAFLRDHDFDGLMAEGAEYAFFDPPRYFSGECLKLTFRGSLETRELILDEVAKRLNLHPNRFCLLAAMLGNHIVNVDELRGFYDELVKTAESPNKDDYRLIVPTVVAFIRNLKSVDDLLALGNFIFSKVDDEKLRQDKAQRFVKSVHYYMNGTKEHFKKFFSAGEVHLTTKRNASSVSKEDSGSISSPLLSPEETQEFASEAHGGELHDAKRDGDVVSSLVDNPEAMSEKMKELVLQEDTEHGEDSNSVSGSDPGTNESPLCGKNVKNSAGSSRSDSNSSTPPIPSDHSNAVKGDSAIEENCDSSLAFEHNGPGGDVASDTDAAAVLAAQSEAKKHADMTPKVTTIHEHTVPQSTNDVIRMAHNRHGRGLMHPWINNVLSQAEIKIESFIEDGMSIDFPPGWIIFRPIRQAVYAILFNVNHKNFLLKQQRDGKSSQPNSPNDSRSGSGNSGEPGKYPSDLSTRIFVKEWVYWSKHNTYQFPEYVPAISLEWKGVPTLQRLWFGQNPEDKKKRLKAFLSCLASDSPLMLNQNHVAPHLLLMCCVLRYMVAYPERQILQRHELDAFLAQAISPQLVDPNAMQEIRSLTPRGIQLSQIFMQGVEHAFFANDACGAPVPWVMCCPWMFFDGKLFQLKLDLAHKKPNLVDVCGDIEQASKVERMRAAILEGMELAFSPHGRFPFQGAGGAAFFRPPFSPGFGPNVSEAARRAHYQRGFGRAGRRELLGRGGQLEIAGVVVGEWGGLDKRSGRGRMAPQIASVGAGGRAVCGPPGPMRPPVPLNVAGPGAGSFCGSPLSFQSPGGGFPSGIGSLQPSMFFTDYYGPMESFPLGGGSAFGGMPLLMSGPNRARSGGRGGRGAQRFRQDGNRQSSAAPAKTSEKKRESPDSTEGTKAVASSGQGVVGNDGENAETLNFATESDGHEELKVESETVAKSNQKDNPSSRKDEDRNNGPLAGNVENEAGGANISENVSTDQSSAV